MKELFAAAAERDAASVPEFLAQACAGDTELVAEVESLLGAHRTESSVVDRPAAECLPAEFLSADEDRWTGRRIGAYEITALIGRGGMGDVYRARRIDAEYEKEVAIKLVPGGLYASQVLQRFRAERQILAGLEHPHIARLIDGGVTPDGAPFLVMELVEGEPLDRYAAQQALRVRERLALFLDVCGAVSYAHRRLVVHRDLKPGNILVTAGGDVKLLDFGIAKLLQPGPETASSPTHTLMRTLTPGYASPEQVLGRTITTASDVYSLGVVLYVLLTGRSPYRRAPESAEDAVREVCETEPLRPSAAPESGAAGREPLGRDLDAILLQALRKEPERRYASVDLFAEDIRRYLGGLPVTARGDALGYRAGKFVRRHRLEVAAAALLALTLVGATAFSLREAHIAEEQRARAERHFADVRGLANTLLFQVHDAIKDLPGATKAREQLVGTALEYLGRLSAEAGDDRRLREELAAAYEKVGDIQGQAYGAATAGEPKAALESYSRAIALLEPIVAAEPAAHAARGALARNLLRKSRLLLLLDESAEAASFSGRAVETSEALVRDAPDDAARKMLADAYTAHAYTADLTGGQDGAGVAFARKSIAILEDLESRNPDDLDAAYRLATAYSSLAITLVGKDARPEVLEESLGYYRKAVVLDERLVAATAGKNAKYSRGLLLDRFNMAFILNEQGDYRGALQNARKAQALLPDLRADAENKQARIDSANLAWPLGRALLALGRADEAEDVFRQAYEELESMVNETDTLKVHYLLGMNAFGLGEVHVHRADAARASPGTRRAELLAAKRWYGVATPHFQRVTAGVTLDSMDMKPVDGAAAGLARVEAELAKPGGGGPG